MDTYERTYSQSLGQPLDNLRGPSTTNDYAIALALAGVSEEERGGPDTSLDSELAHALYEREASKLLRLPSRKVRRRSRALRKLLHYLKPTEVGSRGLQRYLHMHAFAHHQWGHPARGRLCQEVAFL
jgi:hypothetical protein